MFRQGLARLFSDDPRFLPSLDAKDGLEALERIHAFKPDVAILDLMMPEMNGIEVTNRVVTEKLSTRCIILAVQGDLLSSQRAYRAGATGCLLKEASFEELADLVLRAAAGESCLGNLGHSPEPRHGWRSTGLSRREVEVLRLVARGFTSKQIADALFISPYTVDSHRQRIMQKLEISNGPGLVKYAIENGID